MGAVDVEGWIDEDDPTFPGEYAVYGLEPNIGEARVEVSIVYCV